MSNTITDYPVSCEDEDLVYTEFGVAFQKNRNNPISYDDSYFENYIKRSGTEVASDLNKARVGMAEKYCKELIVDIGIGSGEFIESCNKIKSLGFDINEVGVKWLKERNLFVDLYKEIPEKVEGFTLWDTLEHMPNPDEFISIVRKEQYVFISLPTFENLNDVKKSKHYKPNEHFYYFTIQGMLHYMSDHGFSCLEHNDNEVKAGREGVTSFAFVRNFPKK